MLEAVYLTKSKVRQKLFGLLFSDRDDLAAKVDLAKSVLRSLPPTNLLLRGRDAATVASRYLSDAPNLADTFLHPRDRSFSAGELQDLIENQCWLRLQAFTTYQGDPATSRLQYDPAALVTDPALRERIAAMPAALRWQIAEMIDGSLSLHTVYATRQSDTVADFADNSSVPFAPTALEDYNLRLLAHAGADGLEVQLANGTQLSLVAQPATLRFLAAMDGQRSLGEILSGLDPRGDELAHLERDLRLLNTLDWVVLRHRSVRAFRVASGEVAIDAARLGPKPYRIRYTMQVLQPEA